MANKKFTLILCVFLSACGGGGGGGGSGPYDYWTGGIIGVWEPASTPIGVMILHQGHDCFSTYTCVNGYTPAPQHDLERVRAAFVAAGLVVYGVEMPAGEHTSGPSEKYLQPAIDAVNAAGIKYPGLPILMSGLSGGGQTTTVITGMLPQITHGYNVEGGDYGSHWEQANPPLPYPTLYAASQGRFTYIAIPGNGGPCPTGVTYNCVNDPTARSHTFSDWSANYIISQLR